MSTRTKKRTEKAEALPLVTLTTKQALDSLAALSEIVKWDLDFDDAFKVAATARTIDQHVEVYRAEQQKLLGKHRDVNVDEAANGQDKLKNPEMYKAEHDQLLSVPLENVQALDASMIRSRSEDESVEPWILMGVWPLVPGWSELESVGEG